MLGLHCYSFIPLSKSPGSIGQLITRAPGEKIAALITKEYLEERAKRGITSEAFALRLSSIANTLPSDTNN